MSDEHIVSVQVLDRSYKVKCSGEEAHSLEEAAQYVNDQMRRIRTTGSVTNVDRLAVVTALNIAHEFLQLKKQNHSYMDVMSERVQRLQEKISAALEEQQQVEA